MAPTPPPSNLLNVPRAAAPPPPFPTPSAGDKPGLCGLTGDQWHVVMILAILFSIIFAVVIVVSWLTSKEIGFLWLRVQQRAEIARMELRGKLVDNVLSEDDLRIIHIRGQH